MGLFERKETRRPAARKATMAVRAPGRSASPRYTVPSRSRRKPRWGKRIRRALTAPSRGCEAEPLPAGGLPQALVEADERSRLGSVVAPDEGGRQLQRVASPQRVS